MDLEKEQTSPKPVYFRKQKSRAGGRAFFSVKTLWDGRHRLHEPGKRKSMSKFWPVFEAFVEELGAGLVVGDSNMVGHPYYDYLVTKLNPADKNKDGTPKNKGHLHVINKILDAERLYHDIKANGLKSPMTFYKHGKDKRLAIKRGGRRLCILTHLGVLVTAVRVYSDFKSVTLLEPDVEQWQNKLCCKDMQLPTIHELGMKQFQQWKGKSSDKYWVHSYTKLYDKLWDNSYRNKKLKILELGVLRGASLRLWHEAFPNSQIYGLDKNFTMWKKLTSGIDRIQVFVGNEEDSDFMESVAAQGPYDIIIDDCGHHPVIQSKAFDHLWKAVKEHGYFVIEDCHHSYNPGYKGPNFVTRIIERVPELYTDYTLESAQFWYNLCVLQRGIA